MDATTITGHDDPAGEAPWVMQLVAHIDKVDPPSHAAVCEAAAMAVVTLLGDARCEPGGEWHAPVARWLAGRIRKHARKARGAAWVKATALPGLTVVHGGAEVRAFVPCATDAVPRDIAKLRMEGFELTDPAVLNRAPDADAVVVSLSADPVLSTGKAAAAAGHAAQIAAATMSTDRLGAWAATGYQVRVELPTVDEWPERRAAAQVVVVDAGFTDVDPGTCTALAHWEYAKRAPL